MLNRFNLCLLAVEQIKKILLDIDTIYIDGGAINAVSSLDIATFKSLDNLVVCHSSTSSFRVTLSTNSAGVQFAGVLRCKT
jgi:hypothetical protein